MKNNMDNNQSKSMPVSDSPAREVASKFLAKHRRASRELLTNMFEIDPSWVENQKSGKGFAEVKNALQKADQSTLCKFLEREDCPDWLGIWAAKHGLKEHQIAYLFRPNLSDEISISDRISTRPKEIKKLLWGSKAPIVLASLLSFDDETYLTWARDIGFDGVIQAPNLDPKDDEEYVGSSRAQINDWFESVLDPIVDALWKEHVPEKGACTVLQGEMARCIGRLEGEYWKNGMMNMGDGFYDRMVDKIKETVLSKNSFSPLVKRVIGIDASIVKGANYAQIVRLTLFQESDVELSLRRLKNVVAAWCLRNREPIAYNPKPWD